MATLDIVALNSSSPLYPNRLSVFDLCDEARETLSDNAPANIVNDNLTAFRPTPTRTDSFNVKTKREVQPLVGYVTVHCISTEKNEGTSGKMDLNYPKSENFCMTRTEVQM